MEEGSSYFADYGERFWDDVMTNSSDGLDQSDRTDFYDPDGVDILQQSLKEAQIFDGFGNYDPLAFNNYELKINNNNQTPKNTPNGSKKNQISNSIEEFDVTKFLNLTSSPTKTSLTTPVLSKTSNQCHVVPTSTNDSLAKTTTSVSLVNNHHNAVILKSTNQTVQAHLPNISNAYIHLQFPTVGTLSNSNPTSITNPLTISNTHYVLSQVQTTTLPANKHFTVQNTTANACKTAASLLTSSAPVVLSLNSVNNKQVSLPTSMVKTAPSQTVVQTFQHVINQNENTFDDQTNKLALLLKAKAGASNMLRVCNQNFDISNPAVAKMLASKILQQQKLRQQHETTSSSVSKNNASFVNVTGSMSGSPINHQQYQKFTTVSVIASIPSVIVASSSAKMPQKPTTSSNNQTSPAIYIRNSSSPLTHRTATKSASPINRIQIASVNISRTSSLPISSQKNNTSDFSSSSGNNLTLSGTITSSSVLSQVTASQSSSSSLAEPSTLLQHLGTTMKLNIAPELASTMTKEQLQKLVSQHQAAVQARKISNQGAVSVNQLNFQPQTVTSVSEKFSTQNQSQDKIAKIVTFRVDPNISAKQVEEVQQIVFKKIPINKINELTTEQKQLLAAFRAQLRTMEPNVQQYYLRNPHLFMQKVHQHLQTGKAFLLHVKVEEQNTARSIGTSSYTTKPVIYTNVHPTISLVGNNRQKVSTVAVAKSTNSSTVTLHRRVAKRHATNVQEVNPSLLPTKRPSLLMEQLENHRKLAELPNIEAPFKNFRDAFRRLLPYHVYNIPSIQKDEFDKAETIYDRLSERLITKMSKMFKKYHLLCLKEAATDVCSADAVMLERTFLQHEKSSLVEVKSILKDDPDALLTYLPTSYEETNPEVVAFLEDRVNANLQLPSPSSESLDNSRFVYNRTGELHGLTSCNPSPAVQHSLTYDNASAINRDRSEKDILLQEAVESILKS